MTDLAHDPIEAMLARMESRQVKCPNCGSTDGNLMRPLWDLASVRLELDGTVKVGYGEDQTCIDEDVLKPRIACHQCNTQYELPDHAKLDWSGDGILCDCEQAAEDLRIRNLQQHIDDGAAVCRHCGQVAFWIGAYPGTGTGGQWSHSRTHAEAEQRKCGQGNASTWIAVDVPNYEAVPDE